MLGHQTSIESDLLQMIDEDDSHSSKHLLEKPAQKHQHQLQYPAFNNWLPGADEQQALLTPSQLAYNAAPTDFLNHQHSGGQVVPMMPV